MDVVACWWLCDLDRQVLCAFVLDTSGSMNQRTNNGTTYLDRAKVSGALLQGDVAVCPWEWEEVGEK